MNKLFINALLILVGLAIFSCKSDDEEAPSTGKVSGIITDGADASGLATASITVFNANDNSPITTVTSGDDGSYEANIEPGTYFTKVTKQGYLSNPAPGLSAIPFTIVAGETVTNDITLFASSDNNLGLMSGKVTSGGVGVSGVLVVASDGVEAYSAVSDGDGNYTMYNVGTGSYVVSGLIVGYESANVATSVSLDAETTDVNIELTAGAAGSLSGSIRNISAGNLDVDVALVHPITRETIPGLTTFSSAQTYAINNIPTGTYIARATFENDERVMDPDRIFKFGEPEVTLNGDAQELTFDITGSVTINSPTNELATVEPFETTETTPTFEWTAYSSTSDYVIEVTDATTGNVIWGGIDQSGSQPVKNIVIPSSQKSIVYNEDGNASVPALEVGKVYRWRIFASKDDNNSPTGWTLISGSEDQMGLIKIIE